MMQKAPRNKTVSLTDEDRVCLRSQILKLKGQTETEHILNRVINQNILQVVDLLPSNFVDLLFIDPPYNISKNFDGYSFKRVSIEQYAEWMDSWLSRMVKLLKPTTSIYICGDWRSSAAIHTVCEKYFIVRNRITFEREKGRGSLKNWKNNSEDIWFCTVSDNYTFNVERVKLKRKVIAPYRVDGVPKDWQENSYGNFRLTYPSNIWTDITIPFWSMPENTPHPTQKPEKLLAKIILASSNEGDVVFDPFAGVGTTGVVAKKLGRNFVMVEIDEEYCLYAIKRLQMAEHNSRIQGYYDGVFWERNSAPYTARKKTKMENEKSKLPLLFRNKEDKK